jgi:hypothetical protein
MPNGAARDDLNGVISEFDRLARGDAARLDTPEPFVDREQRHPVEVDVVCSDCALGVDQPVPALVALARLRQGHEAQVDEDPRSLDRGARCGRDWHPVVAGDVAKSHVPVEPHDLVRPAAGRASRTGIEGRGTGDAVLGFEEQGGVSRGVVIAALDAPEPERHRVPERIVLEGERPERGHVALDTRRGEDERRLGRRGVPRSASRLAGPRPYGLAVSDRFTVQNAPELTK